MQKKIIALAIAAAFSAPAFADVTMYGTVDAAIAHASVDGLQGGTIGVSGGLSPSRLGVNAGEDLGNGMKAIVNLEYGLDTSTATSIGGTNSVNAVNTSTAANVRQQLLGLTGSFGTVAGGYLQTTGYDFAKKYDPTAESLVDPLQNVVGQNFLIGSNAAAARAQRAFAYISPSFSGVSFAVNYATALTGLGNLGTASTVTGSNTTATLASLGYDMGAFSVTGVYAKTSNDNPANANLTDESLGASYDFGVLKLLGTYQRSTPSGGSANKAESVSGVIPAGPGAVALSYAKNSMSVANTSASAYTLAYLQGLSKSTTVYVAYSHVSEDNGTTAYTVINDALGGVSTTGGASSSLLAVGLNKKF